MTSRSSIMVGGVRMDRPRKCWCGKHPSVSTGYKGFEDGMGPFFLSCKHGEHTKYGVTLPLGPFVRSFSKTRAVALWNRVVRSYGTGEKPQNDRSLKTTSTKKRQGKTTGEQ